LRLRGLAEHPDAFTSSFEEESAKPPEVIASRLDPDGPAVVWGAHVGPALVGVVGLAREARAKNRHKADVFGMYVAREHAGRGIGAALLARLLDEARAVAGLEQLTLTVTRTNPAAVALYERMGFRAFGVETRAIRVGDTYYDKVHMARPL
jgi:RimJ/RimL family protein N-acetyltransferase